MRDELVIVGIAEGKTAVRPEVLVTYALGSCVGVCLYDPLSKIAGMVHVLLPCRALSIEQKNPYKFADSGIKYLLAEMAKQGAVKECITAKLAGGASMFESNGMSEGIGEKNLRAVKTALKDLGIRIVADDTGGNYGRTIYFHTTTGMVLVKSVKEKERWI